MQGILGCEAELKALERFLSVLQDRAAAVVIEGEAGIGKTSVWLEAVHKAERLGFRVLQARSPTSSAPRSTRHGPDRSGICRFILGARLHGEQLGLHLAGYFVAAALVSFVLLVRQYLYAREYWAKHVYWTFASSASIGHSYAPTSGAMFQPHRTSAWDPNAPSDRPGYTTTEVDLARAEMLKGGGGPPSCLVMRLALTLLPVAAIFMIVARGPLTA